MEGGGGNSNALAEAEALRVTSYALPDWLCTVSGGEEVEGSKQPPPFLSSWVSGGGNAALYDSGEDGSGVGTVAMASCVPGRADALQFAAVDDEEGSVRLGRLHLSSSGSSSGGAGGTLSFGLSSVTIDGAAVGAGGLALNALCSDSCYLRPLSGDAAMIVRWEGKEEEEEGGDDGRPHAASVLEVSRTSLHEGADNLPTGATALMPQVQLALSVVVVGGGGGPFEAAWLELSPLLKGGSAFTLAHPPPTTTAANGLRRVAVGFAMGPEEVKEEEGEAAAEGEGGKEEEVVRERSVAPHPPYLAPTLIHAIEAGGGVGEVPPALQLIDLHEGTHRYIPLLPAPKEGEEEDGGGGGGKSKGRYSGWRGLSEADVVDPHAMEALFVSPVPSATGGGAVTLHRNGEMILWQTHHRALASRAKEWRLIVGGGGGGGIGEVRKDGGGGGGDGDGGGGPSGLSIVRDFPSPKAATMPKRGKVDETGAPHVGGNTWAGGTGGRDTAGLGGKGGPYRLSDGNPIHQISEEEKGNVSPEALKAAREMAKEAWKQRLQEIDMSEGEATIYTSLFDAVSREVEQTRVMLEAREARRTERGWLTRQTHGELDEGRIIDGNSSSGRTIHSVCVCTLSTLIVTL